MTQQQTQSHMIKPLPVEGLKKKKKGKKMPSFAQVEKSVAKSKGY